MTDAIRELKIRAEILHKQLQSGCAGSLERLRVLAPYRTASDEELLATAATLRRRDCLNIIAAELGFPHWSHAKAAITGEGEAFDFGTLLYPATAGHLNCWFARYEDAVPVRQSSNGYLLAYKRHFLVVDRHYIESLGLDPGDPDWANIGFDWVRPASVSARTRLYGRLIAGLPRPVSRKEEMSSSVDKKEAIKAYKMRKPARGVFAVRCTATGRVWVNSSPNLDAARNRVWFALSLGDHRNTALQAEWDTYGEPAFQFEILEKLDDDIAPIGLSDVLKEKAQHWTAQLGASRLAY